MNRREFNKLETMRHIKSVFMSLYAEGGINSFTVGTLCQRCSIAKSTFYLYYEDKYQILDSIENQLLDTLREICHDLSDCDMHEVQAGKPLMKATSTVSYLQENADTFRALLGKYGDPRFTYKWKKDIQDSFMDRFRAEKGNTPSAGIACTIFSSALVGLFTHLLFDMPDVTDYEFSIIMGNLLKYSLYEFQAFAE